MAKFLLCSGAREGARKRVDTKVTRSMNGRSKLGLITLAALAVLFRAGSARADEGSAGSARADESTEAARAADESSWHARYAAAREKIVAGEWRAAAIEFRALARVAPTDSERLLAHEMAELAARYAARRAAPQPPAAALPPERPIRSTDELTLLYASSFLYGAGTGSWFLLQTEPDTALTATLPFAALTAAPVLAVATIDGYKKFRRGVPQALSSGLYLGLGQGIWVLGFQYARSSRLRAEDPRSDARWQPESAATVLWGGATLGAALGGVLGSSLVTTPGRVSFVGSTTMWAGVLTGLGGAAILPGDEHRRERSFLAGGIGYNAGLLGGILSAAPVSPSVARVRLVDLLGIAGGVATAGIYLAAAADIEPRVAEGLAVLGAGAGLATGWYLTRNMPKELPSDESPTIVLNPAVSPVRGGATVGLAGAM
jgi:hypothetical protein